MATKVLTNKQLFELKEELQAILEEKISVLLRYKLSDLKKTVESLTTTALEIKDELIKKYGEDDGTGTINLKVWENEAEKKFNPTFLEFTKEWQKILEEEKEVNYTPIKLELIEDIKTSMQINVIFGLLDV